MRLLLLLALLTACAGQGADPVLEALNGIRADGRGCGGAAPPLAWEARLRAAAQAHTEAMAAHGFVGHVAPDGSPVRERTGYPWSALGENVA